VKVEFFVNRPPIHTRGRRRLSSGFMTPIFRSRRWLCDTLSLHVREGLAGIRGGKEVGTADLTTLYSLGTSMWIDYIRRSFMTSGEMDGWLDRGIRGMTSNPTIFDKAIADSDDYDADLRAGAAAAMSAEQAYEALALQDIRLAADRLRRVHEESQGADGFVSLEVRPSLANNTQGTLVEARRLLGTLARPNVLIKVPGTPEGILAVKQLISEGININITLMFSLGHYRHVSEAYLSGLEARVAAGQDVSRVASVASFFVSRVDTAVDRELEKREVSDLQGEIAVANAKLAYELFLQTFSGDRWEYLEKHGAKKQRVLWASTSTKNSRYSDTLYVDNLIGPDTVNTATLSTIEAYLDHGRLETTANARLEEAHQKVDRLSELGIDLDEVTDKLQVDGVKAFSDSFESLLSSVERKRKLFVQAEKA
jgi:transaldolase